MLPVLAAISWLIALFSRCIYYRCLQLPFCLPHLTWKSGFTVYIYREMVQRESPSRLSVPRQLAKPDYMQLIQGSWERGPLIKPWVGERLHSTQRNASTEGEVERSLLLLFLFTCQPLSNEMQRDFTATNLCHFMPWSLQRAFVYPLDWILTSYRTHACVFHMKEPSAMPADPVYPALVCFCSDLQSMTAHDVYLATRAALCPRLQLGAWEYWMA